MDAHVTTTPGTAPLERGHAHPGPATYIKIGLMLFILTALEVAVYELGYNHANAGVGALIHSVVIPILLVLSAIKFALVAMFYMHLRDDSPLLSGIFVFPLIIAVVVVVGLMLLFMYLYSLHF